MPTTTACGACPHPNTDHDPSLHPDNSNPCLVGGCPCTSYQQPLLCYPMADTPMVCPGCDRALQPGDPVRHTPEGMNAGLPVVEVRCVYC